MAIHGNDPSLPAGQRIYAIGDIHGRADLLGRLLDMIAGDIAAHPGPRMTILYLGDYIDRGPENLEVIERVKGPHPFADEVICLRGNHEEALLNFIDDPWASQYWLSYGGGATLVSYGVRVPSTVPVEARLGYMAQQLDERLPDAHREFLKSLSVSASFGDYLFVHAGVDPRVPLDRQDPFDLTTIRNPFLEWGRPLEKVVVHGHSIEPEPQFRPWRIGIDTGAFATGHLTCLVLEGTDRRLIAT